MIEHSPQILASKEKASMFEMAWGNRKLNGARRQKLERHNHGQQAVKHIKLCFVLLKVKKREPLTVSIPQQGRL